MFPRIRPSCGHPITTCSRCLLLQNLCPIARHRRLLRVDPDWRCRLAAASAAALDRPPSGHHRARGRCRERPDARAARVARSALLSGRSPFGACGGGIPTGFRPIAQGCRARAATLGARHGKNDQPQRGCVPFHRSRLHHSFDMLRFDIRARSRLRIKSPSLSNRPGDPARGDPAGRNRHTPAHTGRKKIRVESIRTACGRCFEGPSGVESALRCVPVCAEVCA